MRLMRPRACADADCLLPEMQQNGMFLMVKCMH